MFLKATVLPVEQVYASDHQLVLPWFQRAYAWSEPHVGGLIHDLLEAMDGQRRRYSLGHITLARAPAATTASVIDGHQRSISLTILCALLRDLIGTGDVADRLHRLVVAPGGGLRLMPQPSIAKFFLEHVQTRGVATAEYTGDPMDLSPSERNILANRDHMARMLRKDAPSQQDQIKFAVFLLENCFIVVDEVEDEDEARDLLVREETRGLSPHSSELAKVTILTALPSEEQEEAATLFEGVQTQLSADDMSSLLDHMRVLKVRRRSSRPVDGELIQKFRLNKTGLPFLRDELLPRAATLVRLIKRDVGSGDVRQSISRSLDMLYWLDHQMWVPPALHWIALKTAEHPETPQFFAALERLSYLLKIAAADPTEQEKRYLRVLDAIDTDQHVVDMAPLSIERKLLSAALENLRSRSFYAKRFHALVLRRISVNIDRNLDPGPVDGDRVTVEHILPRKPAPGQQWIKDFPEGQVVDYCNRIGNLAFLSHSENVIAANSDFMAKSFILANAGGRFVLSARAALEKEWNPATIMRRSEEMIGILLEPWQLLPS